MLPVTLVIMVLQVTAHRFQNRKMMKMTPIVPVDAWFWIRRIHTLMHQVSPAVSPRRCGRG